MNRLFNGTAKYKDFTSKDVEAFAKKHGYKYIKSRSVDESESGYYMNAGYYNEKVDIVSWQKDGVEFEFYTRFMNFESLEKLSDKVEDKIRNRILLGLVFSMKLPYKLPSVMVQSLTAKTVWNILGFTELFVGKKVKLEGNFNRFFHVYTPTGEAPNAFLALAPDTMVKMLRAGSGMDFQFAGDRIYFMYDQRIKARNIKNMWGFLTDMEKIELDKSLNVKLIDWAEWQNVFDRSKEYSLDILSAFRAMKQKETAKPLYYYPVTGKKLSLIIILQTFILVISATLIFIYPEALLVVVPLLFLWVVTRVFLWNSRRKKLLRDWDEGVIAKVIR